MNEKHVWEVSTNGMFGCVQPLSFCLLFSDIFPPSIAFFSFLFSPFSCSHPRPFSPVLKQQQTTRGRGKERKSTTLAPGNQHPSLGKEERGFPTHPAGCACAAGPHKAIRVSSEAPGRRVRLHCSQRCGDALLDSQPFLTNPGREWVGLQGFSLLPNMPLLILCPGQLPHSPPTVVMVLILPAADSTPF